MPKKSNKLILISCILMLVMPFFIFNVGASDVVIEDFDSYGEGVYAGSNDYITWVGEENNAITSTDKVVSSPLSLRIDPTNVEKYNTFTFNDNMSMEGFEFWFTFSTDNDDCYTIVELYNQTNVVIVKFKVEYQEGAFGEFSIYDFDGWEVMDDMPTANSWLNFGFQGNHTEGNPVNYVYYYAKDSNGDKIDSIEKRWISALEYDDTVEISKIRLLTKDNDADEGYGYFDDFALVDYTPPEYQGDFAFDSTNKIGSIDTTCTIGISHKTIEFGYDVPVTINATGFDLLVDSAMHYWDDDLSNYDLFINGESMGDPTEWKEYGNFYVLRWIFSAPKVFDNSRIFFEVWHDVKIPLNYWNVGVGCNRIDLNGDLFVLMKHSDTYPNGVFDGTWLQYDIAYQIYYDTITFVEDVLDITYNSISTIDGLYNVGDSVPLTYTIKTSDLVYENYIRVWNNDTSIEITINSKQGFPYLCLYQLETVGFVPVTSANYTAHLYINGVDIINVSFFVGENANPDMHVYTYPNPSKVGQEIRVQYNFDHPSDRDGAIFLCTSPNLNSYISVNYLSDGDSGFWSETHDIAGTYYYILAVDITGNSTYGIVDDGIHSHRVVGEQGDNYFTLGSDSLILNEEGIATQTVTGDSNLISGNCYIYDNNKLIKTITESSFFYSYDIHTAGLHTVEMRLITNITTVLFTQNYTVTTFTGEEEIEDTSYIVREWIYDLYGDMGVFLLGVCVIFGCMFIPFALVLGVNVKFNKNIAIGDIHWSIYIIFAIVGVIVDVQLHLAEVWIVLLVCVVSIAIAVVTWKGNRI